MATPAAAPTAASKGALKPYHPENTECLFALNHGVLSHDRGEWLAREHGLKAGDTGVRAWHVTSCVRDPANMEEWIMLYDHVNMGLALGLDACQTPMCWAEDAYPPEMLDVIHEENGDMGQKVDDFLKVNNPDTTGEFVLQTDHFAIHASPTTCRVVLSLSHHA